MRQRLRTERINRQLHNYNERIQTPLSIIDKMSRQKISMDIGRPEQHSQQVVLIDIYRILNNSRIYILFKHMEHSTSVTVL